MSKIIITKTCCHCKKLKPISNFNKNRATKDSYQDQCKFCKRESDKKYRQPKKRKEIAREYMQKYSKTEKFKIYQKQYRQSIIGKNTQKRYLQTKKGKQCRKRYRIKHFKKQQARHAVANAVTFGKLPNPISLSCYYCPAQAQQYHHWHGYEPEHHLDIVPVCIICHKNLKEEGGV